MSSELFSFMQKNITQLIKSTMAYFRLLPHPVESQFTPHFNLDVTYLAINESVFVIRNRFLVRIIR